MKGFERDVGSKTTLRITYPEGAMQRPEQYERDSLFVLAGFKWQDFKWLKYIVYKERVVSSQLQAPLLLPPASQSSTRPSHWIPQRTKRKLQNDPKLKDSKSTTGQRPINGRVPNELLELKCLLSTTCL